MHGSRVAVIVAAASLVACAPEYKYVPTTNATSTIAGRSASEYPIPPAAPQGDVRIASFGLTNLTTKAKPDEKIRAVHLRMIVANNSPVPWQLDTREQSLDLSGFGPGKAAFASASRGSTPPVVVIPAGDKRTVDMFFPLPPSEQHASKIPSFDALWRVQTGAGVVAERAPFERIRVQPAPGPYDYGDNYWWGPPYWYDPGYEGAGWGMGIGPGYMAGPDIRGE